MKHIPITEQTNPKTSSLDQLSAFQLAGVFEHANQEAARAVRLAHKAVATLILRAANTYAKGNKIIFLGAGTSGRLGVLEAAECVPTFGTNPKQIVGIIAGGKNAMFRAQEGAEDNATQGAKDIANIASLNDLVIGLAASGNTPYVQGALQKAQKIGAQTVLISCNPQANTTYTDLFVYLPTGPEVLAGSTRLKAGSATKMVLNAVTTGAMVLCGKTYGNWMVDVRPTNQKLTQRALRLIVALAHTDEKTARRLFIESGKHVKTAIVMHHKNCTRKTAQKKLKKANGFLAGALHE